MGGSRYRGPDDTRLDKMVADLIKRVRSLETNNRIGFTSIDRGMLVDNTYHVGVALAGSTSSGGTATQTILSAETDATSSYDDLATVGPSFSVTIGQAARALVFVSANVHVVVNGSDTNFAYMSFTMVGGTTTINPSDNNAAGFKHTNASAAVATFDVAIGRVVPLINVPAGTYTVTAKYSGGTGAGGAVTFSGRSLTVIPY